MVAYLRSQSHKFPVALIAGVAVVALVAAIVGAMSASALRQVVDTLSLTELLPDDRGARLALALFGGICLGAIVWAILVLTVGTHILLHKAGADAPVLRPGDAHPDAPARRPIRASEELGPPLNLGEASPSEQPLPDNLDQPRAAFDPAALPVEPQEPGRAATALVRPERMETFELTPLVRDHAATTASLASLLDRLEKGAAENRRQPARSLGDALAALRDNPAY